MKCPICGREVNEVLEVCDLCGSPVNTSCEEPVPVEPSVTSVPYVVAPVTDGQYTPEYVPQYQGNSPFYPPFSPVKKKRKKWPIVVLCVVLALAIAVGSIVAVYLSQPKYVIARAFNDTFIESENLSFEITIGSDGEEICFEGAFVRGDTPEENLYYIFWDQYIGFADEYIKFEYGICNGKIYSSYGEFDMEDPDYWSDIEELLEDEFDIDADIDDIYSRLSDEDITEDEIAEIYDEEIFPLIEEIIYAVTGEEVEFPPFADIRDSVVAFFDGFVDKYISIEEVEQSEEYTFEINVDTIFKDFLDYMEEDETLSQVLDILDVILGDDEEEDSEDDEEAEDEDELIISGSIFIDEDGYIDTVEITIDEVDVTVEISDVNDTELDESDIMDIDVLFDVNEAEDFFDSF